MANHTSTLTVRMLDLVSGPAAAASRALLGIGNAAAAANARGMATGLAGSLATIARHADTAHRRLTAMANSMRSLQMPALFAGGFALRAIHDFDKVGNALEAFGEVTRAQRRELERYAQALNSAFSFSNVEILGGMVELAKQGLTPEQIRGSIRGILQLAQAGDIGISTAAEYALGAVRGMQLPMQTAEQMAASIQRMNDLIAFVAAKSSATAEDVAQAFKFAGPVMAATGSSPEHLGAMIMAMRNANIPGSEIGVAIRSMLVSLVKAGPQQQGAFARLGIDRSQYVSGRQITADNIISSLGLAGINATALKAQIEAAISSPGAMRNMAALTTSLTDIVAGSGAGGAMDRTAIAAAMSDSLNVASMNIDLFGLLRAIRDRGGEGELVNIFQGQQFARVLTALRGPLQDFLGQITRGASGYAQRVAETRMQGLPAAWNAFTAAVDSFILKLADSGLRQAAINTLDGLSSFIKKLTEFNPVALMIGTALTGIVAVGGSALLVMAGISRFVSMIAAQGAALALAQAGAGASGVATGLGAGAAGLATGTAGAAAASRWARLAQLGRFGLYGVGAWGVYGALEAADAQTQAWREANPGLAGRMARGEKMFEAPPPPAPTPVPGRLPSVQDFMADLQSGNLHGGVASAGQQSGQAFGGAFASGAQSGATDFMALAEQRLRAWASGLNLNVTITPRIDMSGINGLHADMGVAPQR